MSDLVVSRDELIELSGYRTKSRQIMWLRSYAIPYRIRADGHPSVLRADLIIRQNGEKGPTKPNPTALKMLMRKAT